MLTADDSSTAGAHFPPVPGLSGYSPSKTAAASLIAYLQAENPELHVTNFHPGILETPVRTAHSSFSSQDHNPFLPVPTDHSLCFTDGHQIPIRRDEK